MASRLAIAAALVVGLSGLAVPTAAFAEDPVALGGAYVLDTVGVLDGREAEVGEALDELYADAGIQMFVVYVDTFTGVGADESWAMAAAELNGLGPADLLLAVAVDDRNFDYWYGDEFPVSDATVIEIENDVIIPNLRDNEWAAAAIEAAEAYGNAGAGGGGVPIVPILIVLAIVGVIIFFIARNRSKNGAARTAAPEKLTQKQLDQRAGSLLVQLDDELRTSEEELGFAIAQFGEGATKQFSKALAGARAKVAEAFELKQALDDAKPDTAEEKRSMTTRIIQLCEAADAELDAQADAFDELRKLEQTAPQAADAVAATLEPLRKRIAGAEKEIARLNEQYSAEAVAPAAGNPEQASRLLAATTNALEEARTALDEGRSSDAAVAVASAQASVGQATQLLDGVDTLGKDLQEASARLDEAIGDARADLAEAQAVPSTGATAADAARLAPLVASTSTALESVSHDAKANPISSLGRIEQLRSRLGEGLASARNTQTRLAKAQAALDRTLVSARSEISSAEQFISTRRGAIGADARTRVSEARRHLDKAVALATTDPEAALREAEQAGDLARTASRQAQADLQGFSPSGLGGGRSSGGDAVLGAVIGGLLGSGMGSRGGVFGGSSRGGMLGGGSPRRGGSSARPSFGGSSRRGGSGGGRASRGIGGKSRGGRF